VSPASGFSPRYYMATTYAARRLADRTWDASKGTIALHWEHWSEVCGYDERMEGYGIEDGECYHRATRCEGRTVERLLLPFWHISHSEGNPRKGRDDRWNGKSINPRNHGYNQKQMQAGIWANESWGVPI
jgi:hypothetical protein